MTEPITLETKIEMLDSSIFTFPNKYWLKAFKIKYGDNEEEAIKIFKELTQKHFNNKSVPTKFDEDDKWKQEYKNQAELGLDVMYQYIRASLLAIVMSEMAKETGEEKPEVAVIGIGKDRTTLYTKDSKKELP